MTYVVESILVQFPAACRERFRSSGFIPALGAGSLIFPYNCLVAILRHSYGGSMKKSIAKWIAATTIFGATFIAAAPVYAGGVCVCAGNVCVCVLW